MYNIYKIASNIGQCKTRLNNKNFKNSIFVLMVQDEWFHYFMKMKLK